MGTGTWLGFSFGVLAPFLVRDLHLSDVQVGALPSVMYATGALFAGRAGRLVDRLGTHRASRLVPLAVGVASACLVLARSWVVLVAVAVIAGVGVAMTNPVTNRWVVDAVPVRLRGSAMGGKQAGVSAASFLTGAVLPSFAVSFGWRAASVVGAAIAGLAWFGSARALRRTVDHRATGAVPASRRSDHQVVTGTQAYAAVLGAANGVLSAYLVLYGVRTLLQAEAVAGSAAAVVGLIAMGARIGWATLGSRTGQPVRWLRTIAVLAACGFTALAALPSGEVAYALVVAGVLGGSAVAWQGLAMTAAVEGVAHDRVGQVSGGVARAFYTGFVTGPLLFGAAADAGIAYRALWLVAAAASVLAAVLVRASR